MENTVVRIVGYVFFGLLLLLGVLSVSALVALFVNMFRSLFWPAAAGTITRSEVEIRDRKIGNDTHGDAAHVSHAAHIRYAFEVDGRPVEGRQVYFQNITSGNLPLYQRLVHAYPVGSQVTVYHHPTHPEFAVLDRGLPPGFYGGVVFATLATAVGGKALLVLAGVLPFHQPDLLLLVTVLLALFGIGLLRAGASAIRMGLASRTWPTAPAEIIRSTVLRSHLSKKPAFQADIAYRYMVDDREYVSHNLRAGGGRDGTTRRKAEQFAALYPVGKPVEAHFNPLDPAEAVLVPGVDWMAGLVVVLGLGFLGGAVVVGLQLL